MRITILSNRDTLGAAAGEKAGELIRLAIQAKGSANIIMATGASQLATIEKLVSDKSIDWSCVTMFHLDEYIGLPETAPASFRKYLRERFLLKLPPLKSVYLINGEGDVAKECERLKSAITGQPIDVALVGIGENGHLAFNDPPADFETEEPYIVVDLDEDCRRQQLGEGWFTSLDEVPGKAISMSVKQIMKSKAIICSVPDDRKAKAVENCFTKEVSNLYPASILRLHRECDCYLDEASASRLDRTKL